MTSIAVLSRLALAVALTGVFAVDAAMAQRSGNQRAISFCDGFAYVAAVTNVEDAVQSTASSSLVLMPSSEVELLGGSENLYIVTLTGRASATGGGNWIVRAQVSVDGGAFTDMAPAGSVIFHSGNAAQTHAMTWCSRYEATTGSVVRILWAKKGGGTAKIDNYTVRVDVYE